MAKKPKISLADAMTNDAATDFINGAPDAKPAKTKSDEKVRANFDVEKGLYHDLRRVALETGSTVSNLLREAAEAIVSKHKI